MTRRALAFTAAAVVIGACGGDLHLSSAPVPGADAGADGATTTRPACSDDGACGALHCDPTSRACVACVVDAHCTGSDRPRCDAALHRCVECGLPSDCDARETCQPDTRRCVTACVDASACPSGAPICDAQRGFCLECRVDTDCREGDRPSCDARAGRCVACRTDADCKKGEEPLCNEEGSCVECRTSLDCPADKPLCDPARWECKGS